VQTRSMADTVDVEDVRAAARRLAGVAHRTPVLTSRTVDELTGATVLSKAECFQRVGAFKFRGAYNAVTALEPATRARGILAYSSGNHAQAVALAARLHGVPAVIVMPHDAPPTKAAATEGYGAEVVRYDRYTQDRAELGEALAAERRLTVIPPYDHLDVIAGQGTVALELIEEVGPLDVLVVCVGGGGLISGCATAAAALSPGVRIVGVEPARGDDVRRSLAAGHRVSVPVPSTIADGQQTTSPGELTFPIIKRLVDEIVVVTDEEIVAAMVLAFERMKVVLEPSGASALAALLAGRVPGVVGRRVGVTLSGGNVGVARFAELTGAYGPRWH
jgi:threo-3-hydroxy-L-aspartate ammonia-lyase